MTRSWGAQAIAALLLALGIVVLPGAGGAKAESAYDTAYQTTDRLVLKAEGLSFAPDFLVDVTHSWRALVLDHRNWSGYDGGSGPSAIQTAVGSLSRALESGNWFVSSSESRYTSLSGTSSVADTAVVCWDVGGLSLQWVTVGNGETGILAYGSGEAEDLAVYGCADLVPWQNPPNDVSGGVQVQLVAQFGVTLSNSVTEHYWGGLPLARHFDGRIDNPNYPPGYSGLPIRGAGAPSDSCSTFHYVAVRGSSEEPQYSLPPKEEDLPDGSPYPAGTGMGAILSAQFAGLKIAVDQLPESPGPVVTKPSIKGVGIVYPAIPVDLLNAAYGPNYKRSISIGAKRLATALEDINRDCPYTKIALAGYSQGADVIRQVLGQAHVSGDSALLSQVKAITFYGDPARNGQSGVIQLDDQEGFGLRRSLFPIVRETLPDDDPDSDLVTNADGDGDAWITANNGTIPVWSFCTNQDVVCDTSDVTDLALKVGIVGYAVGGLIGGVALPAFVADAAIKTHTSYQERLVSPCSEPRAGLSISRIEFAYCGAHLTGWALAPDEYVPPPVVIPPPPVLGFKPGTEVFSVNKLGEPNTVYSGALYSDPVSVGSFTTDGDGFGVLQFVIPASISEGEHHLVITSATGRTYSTPIVIAHDAAPNPVDLIEFTVESVDTTITTIAGSAPTGRVGDEYSFTFPTSGTTPISVALTDGSGPLPPGLTLSSAGRLSGTPTAAGEYPIEVRASGPSGDSTAHAVTITIDSSPAPTVTGLPPAATVKKSYRHEFDLGGNPTPTVTLTSGALPKGMTLSADGVLSGTPSKAGTYPFTITASNGTEPYQTLDATLTVHPALKKPGISGKPPAFPVEEPFQFTFTLTGSPNTEIVAVSGAPDWLTWEADGTFRGTPPSAGKYKLAVTLQNEAGTAKKSVTISVPVKPGDSKPAMKGKFPTVTAGQPFETQFELTGNPAPQLSAIGAPDWLTVEPDGRIHADKPVAGKHKLTLVATSRAGIVKKTLTLKVG